MQDIKIQILQGQGHHNAFYYITSTLLVIDLLEVI